MTSINATGERRSTSTRVLLMLPLAVAVPMSLSNATAQPLSILLLAPFAFVGIVSNPISLTLSLYCIIVSYCNYILDSSGHYSTYQLFRSIASFVFVTVFIFSFRELKEYFNSKIEDGTIKEKAIDRAIIFVSALQLLQTLMFFAGIRGYNMATSSEDGQRILLFPSTYAVMVLFYFLVRGNLLGTIIIAPVILATGSKTALAAMALAALLAYFRRVTLKSTIRYAAMATIAVVALEATSPVIVERAIQFITEEQGQDYTREYEISHAKQSFFRSEWTILFGNGLSRSLTPGVPTRDPAWAENSKFDIENAYWSLLAKLGTVGFSILVIALFRIRFTLTWVLALSIFVMYGFRTSYLFFTNFDGAYFLLTTILVDTLLDRSRRKDEPTKLGAPDSQVERT